QGDYARETVFADDPSEMARRWADAGAEWLHLVDLDGARAGQPVNTDAIRRIVTTVDVPCQLGGGLRDADAIQLMLNEVGVTRVIIGTQALENPDWFREMVAAHPERLVLGIDARDSMVATAGWLDVSQVSAIDLARQYADLQLAAIVYTNIANDGMMQGIDQHTLDDLVELTKLGLPVIASGGVSTMRDITNLANLHEQHPGLVGAIVGRAIYEGTIDVAQAVACLADHPC
ncbi:MAG: 1-(5-phosphoribosyl)-5-[(5-phosphoribosylamino)methylideneamino] imidazole-4-carboxamide isomerase, partial [Planctomycetaceae bacterium]